MYTSLNIQKIIIRFLISLPITVSLVLTPYIPISASFRSEKVGCYDFMPDAAGSEGSPFMLEENAWANFEASRFNEGPQIATFIQQSVLSPNHVDGEPHSVVSLMHERHTMMHIFLADSHREWERHLLNRQQISNLDRLQEEIEEQLNKQEQKLQETQETLEKKLAEIEEEKQKLRERYGHEEQEEGIEGEHDFTPLQQRHLQEKSLFRQKEEDYILEERHQHEQIDLITKYLNEQLKLTRKHRTETNRINKLERISHQSKVDLICIRAAGQGDPTQDEIDRKTHDLLEAEHQREQEELTREHQQQLVGVEEEERAAIVERQQRARTDLEAQQQDEMTVVQARDRYKREILLISKRQEERAHLTQQQILEEFSLKNRQEKEILIYKQRQRDELVRYHARLRAKESGRLLEDQESKMLTNLYEGNDSIFQQKWNNLIDSQDQQLIDLVAYHKKQKSALRRKNKAYETIFEDIANNDFTKSLIACTKAIRSDLKGRINTPDAKHHLTTIVKTLGVKRSLGIVEGYNLALAILHRKTNWLEVVDQVRSPNFPLEYDESLKNLRKKELKVQIKQKAFEALKVSADRGFIPAMSLLSVVYNKSNYRWLITRIFTLGIAMNKELLGQIFPNPARAAELARIAGFLGGDSAALLNLASLSNQGLSGVRVAIRDERLLAEYQYVLAALALTDDEQNYLKRCANNKVTRYTGYVKTFQGFQEAADIVAKFAKTANDLNTIASAFSGMPTSILRGIHRGATSSVTTTVAPPGITTAVTNTTL